MGANKINDARKSYPTVIPQNRNKGMINKIKSAKVFFEESAPKNNNMVKVQPNVKPKSFRCRYGRIQMRGSCNELYSDNTCQSLQ